MDGALGEASIFHATHGFYVHGVSIETAALPDEWDSRTITVRNANTRFKSGQCLEAHDLAASKLAAYREKDLEFVTILLIEGLISSETLVARVRRLPVDEETRTRLLRWVEMTTRAL